MNRTLYRVSSQIEVRKEVISNGSDLLLSSASLSAKIYWKIRCYQPPCSKEKKERKKERKEGKKKGNHVPLLFLNQIHLVQKAEDFSFTGILKDGLQARLVVMHVFFNLTAFNIKNVN